MIIIDYYLSAVSPWTYLGHERFVELAREHGATIRWRPMKLGTVFDETGGLPLPKRAPQRQRYRLVELLRWREKRGLPLNLHPAFFPADSGLADRCAIVLDKQGEEPSAFYSRAQRAVWVEDRNVADPEVVAALLTDAGHEAGSVIEQSGQEEIADIYERNTREAIGNDVFGAPCYVLNGEPFWGQDRLELLADALVSGRPAYQAQ